MVGFIIGILFSYVIISSYIFYRIIKRIKNMKVTEEDIENYLLDNFLEVDTDV